MTKPASICPGSIIPRSTIWWTRYRLRPMRRTPCGQSRIKGCSYRWSPIQNKSWYIKSFGQKNIDAFFDDIRAADQNSLDKEKRCQNIIEARKILPGEVLYVGDTGFDIALACRVGFDSCLIDNSTSWINKQPHPLNARATYVVSDIKSVLKHCC